MKTEIFTLHGPREYAGSSTFQRESINECLSLLHRLVSYSWDHAFKHEGWYITDASDNVVMGEKPA